MFSITFKIASIAFPFNEPQHYKFVTFHASVLDQTSEPSTKGKELSTGDEPPIRLLAIQAKNERSGFYLAWVPAELTDDQVVAAFNELGIEAERAMEVGDWKTTTQHVMLAYISFPPPVRLLEPSRS